MDTTSAGQHFLESVLNVVNLAGLFLWLYSVLQITFSRKIEFQSKLIYVLCGGILFFAALGIYTFIGHNIGLYCAPLFSFSYFLASLSTSK